MTLLARQTQSEAGHSSAALAYSPVIKDRVAARPPVDDGEQSLVAYLITVVRETPSSPAIRV